MIRYFQLFFVLAILSSAQSSWAKNLLCETPTITGMKNAPAGMESEVIDRHVITYEIVRGDCDEGYAFEIEGYGPGLFHGGTGFVISCPYVTNFRGTYGGLKIHAAVLLGLNTAAYVGPGVCFILGLEGGVGFGASLGVLRIRHKSDVEDVKRAEPETNDVEEVKPPQPAKKNLEVPEEMKGDMPSNESSQANSESYKEREFDR